VRSRPSPARRCAYHVVRRVFEDGAYADRAFRAEAARLGLEGRERAFAMRLAYGTIQRKATLDHLIERLTERSLRHLDPPLLAALRLGVYQIVYLDVSDHAAVNESVELAKAHRRGGHRLANAVLRRAVKEAPALAGALGEATADEAALRHSHPAWLATLWWESLGEREAIALMRQDNEPPESAVRANTLVVTAGELVSLLGREHVAARPDPLAPEAVVIEQAWDVHGSRAFSQGLLMPQARASMLVARVVDPQPGERVLDLCAAPGAKTTHLAALMRDTGTVVALDRDERRLRALVANCERLSVRSVEPFAGDVRERSFGRGFDRVLVDPPCSDLGTLQARPDVRWRKKTRQIDELAALQGEILEAGARAVRPGGRLVYSTCTISPAENERQIGRLLAEHAEFSLLDLADPYPQASTKEGFVQTFPHVHRTDGFFIAALARDGDDD
jgi:16S rRNA (cytosine967-C5)-methyltransferase